MAGGPAIGPSVLQESNDMLIGVTSFAFRWFVQQQGRGATGSSLHFDLLRKAKECDAEVVQFCENLPLHHFSKRELASLRQAAADLGLGIEVGIRCCRRDVLQRYLSIAELLQSRILRVVLEDDENPPARSQLPALIGALVPELRSKEITLAIENRQSQTPAEIKDLVLSIGDPHVRVCVDFLNSLYHLAGPREVIGALGPFAATAHAKDATVSRCGNGFLARSSVLGEGVVDVTGAFDQLCSTGNLLSMHVESYLDQSSPSEDALGQEQEHARKGLRFLAEARRRREPSDLRPWAHDER